MTTRDSTKRATAGGVSAEACAAEVLEVMPSVMGAVRACMRDQLHGGLSVPQFRCLNFIDRHPGTSVGEVAAFLGVTMATASAMVDRLARAGLAMPGVSAQDRRRAVLNVSAEGRALLARMRRGAQRELASAFARRAPAELRAVVEAMAVLRGVFVRTP